MIEILAMLVLLVLKPPTCRLCISIPFLDLDKAGGEEDGIVVLELFPGPCDLGPLFNLLFDPFLALFPTLDRVAVFCRLDVLILVSSSSSSSKSSWPSISMSSSLSSYSAMYSFVAKLTC